MSDQSSTETSKNTTHMREEYPCPKWDQHPQAQQSKGYRPTS